MKATESWSKGDVDVGFKALRELPYAMNSVRQSYEGQIADEGQP